jgi:uncharacterized cupredoxin-like copper-binding protein
MPPALSSSDADNKICPGESVTFTASAAIAAYYEFLIDDISVQNSTTNTYTTKSLTNGQVVTVKAIPSTGCASAPSNSMVITVNNPPVVNLLSSDFDHSICPGETVTFTATSATASTYEFLVNGSSVQNGPSDEFITSTLTNGQTITVRGYDGNGCSTLSTGITITVNPVPFVILTSSEFDQTICAGDGVTFIAFTSIPVASYNFLINGASVQNSSSATFSTTSLLNTDIVTVEATTAAGCSALSNTISFTVKSLPSITLSDSDPDDIICVGEAITFTAISATADSYEFFVNGSSVQKGSSTQYITSSLTNGQTVTVQANSADGCSITSSGITFTVNSLPTVNLISDKSTICSGETVLFTANSVTATEFEFFVDGISVQNSASNTYVTSSLTNGQIVTVKVSDGNTCTALSNSVTTIVNPLPLISMFSSDADNVICAGDVITFTANAPTATNYEFFVDGVSVQNSATNLYSTSSLTDGQTVTVQATTASGCAALHAGIVTTVNPLPAVNLVSSDVDNTICAGGSVTFTATSATGISYAFFVDGVSKQSGTSNQYVTSVLSDGQTVSVKIFDNNGCSIVSSGITTTVNQIPVVLLTSSDADNTICPGESITFTATSATASMYEFFVDGISVQNSASNIYVTSSLTNSQTVTAKATTTSGCATVSNGITTFVNILTAILSSSDADNVICAGDVVTFTANAPTATNYEFFVDGVSVQNSATNLYITSSLTDGQTVTVQTTTASGCTDLSLGVITVVNPLPTVSLTSSDTDNTICFGQQITFIASSPTASMYEFFVDNVSVQNSASSQYITNSLLNGQVVQVKAITAANCFVVSNGIATTVNAIPIVVLSSSDADNTICPGESVSFTAYAPTAVNYEFFVNSISVQNSTSNIYLTTGLLDGQIVTVKVTTASSCSAISAGITTSVTNLAVTLSSSDADNIICPGETITFTANSATATGFEFFVDGVSVQNNTTNTYTTSSLTNGQTVHVVASVGVCSLSSNSIPVAVELMTVSLTSNDADNRICPGVTVTFTANSSTAITYEFFVDGTSVQNGASNTYTTNALIDGQNISVKAVSAGGCEAIHSGIVTDVEDISSVNKLGYR